MHVFFQNFVIFCHVYVCNDIIEEKYYNVYENTLLTTVYRTQNVSFYFFKG